jgi:hypothetical protein
MNLEETWKECIRMWKWISRQWLKPSHPGINALKRKWLETNGYEVFSIAEWCFFCDFARGFCDYCPGREIDSNFSCTNGKYHYRIKPREFYQELKQLNKIRMKKCTEKKRQQKT